MIVIIDYGMGNLGSIQNMLKKVGVKSVITSEISEIEKADSLIFPGVGAFGNGMKNISKMKLIPILNNIVIKNETPILGICLGMQLFSNKSEEGDVKGLGWINAETIKFKFDNSKIDLRIPHMGWNTIKETKEDPIFNNFQEKNRYYFVHSYHVVCNNKEDILAKTHYGYDFASMIKRDNIIGVQFHPEKSHKFGMQLLKNFTEIC
ncbi:MAG: imidazole glycerol phosphate synthase subunit HisH [Thermoplasmatales archaeon]|nr:imidazole glycerol phosphate synthase subunit HisH [Thermoplasmatales archaeon]